MVREEIFGKTENGVEVYKFVFSNGGTEAEITNYGASVISLRRVGFNGDPVDIVCGYPTLSGYEKDRHYLGATVGRTSGRIAGGRFVLYGKTVLLNKNDGENHLHGGIQGFNKKVWNVYEVWKNGVSFRYNSPDGEENYPGLLKVRADFYITSDGSFNIEYGAESNKTTLCDITNHMYFNMDGEGAGNIESNLLRIYSHSFTPVGESLVPEGKVKAVEGTPFDFNFFKEIGKDIGSDDIQLKRCGGYDHNFVCEKAAGSFGTLAEAIGKKSRIRMRVKSNADCVQFYSGNGLDNIGGKTVIYKRRAGFALEPQVCPNAINIEGFLAPVLIKGAEYRKRIEYSFSAERFLL